MLVFFTLFVIISLLLIPFAWVVSVVDKIKNRNSFKTPLEKALSLWLFIPFGGVILVGDFLADIYYFWLNNFRDDLK